MMNVSKSITETIRGLGSTRLTSPNFVGGMAFLLLLAGLLLVAISQFFAATQNT
jgi:hypothetical protein